MYFIQEVIQINYKEHGEQLFMYKDFSIIFFFFQKAERDEQEQFI